ncbi:hypothetical protein ACS5UA_15915 [Brucella sp. RRSP16]|uniref:hypothetical protein n=1 Tax=unclassified Brucella TaxID=2632610 RepID=UPI0015DF9205|nr:hypothetical protein [Brucella sp. 191011898]CAB4327531.1 hypothetical protein BCH_02942 [Brucella sp. 191011898]
MKKETENPSILTIPPTVYTSEGGRIIRLCRPYAPMPVHDACGNLTDLDLARTLDDYGHPEFYLLACRAHDLDDIEALPGAVRSTLHDIMSWNDDVTNQLAAQIAARHDPRFLLIDNGIRPDRYSVIDAPANQRVYAAINFYHRCREFVERVEARCGMFGFSHSNDRGA